MSDEPFIQKVTIPDEFYLRVERKGDRWWVVTAPAYPGLYIASQQLDEALSDVSLSLSTLLRLDAEAAL